MTAGSETQFSKAPLILKYITFFAVCCGSIGNVIVLRCIGPSSTSFSYSYNVRKSSISQVTSIFALTNLAGAIFVGFLFRRMNRQVGTIIVLIFEAIAVALLPNLPSLTWFALAAGVCGFCAGIYNTAQTAWVIHIWRHESGPFIMAQYFFFAIGSLIAPLLFEPFLEDDEDVEYDWPSWSTPPEIIEPSASPNFFVPFAITGAIVLLAALFQLVLYFIYRKRSLASLSESTRTTSDDNQPEEAKAEESQRAEEQPISRKRTIILIILCSVVIGFITTTNQITTSFFSKFAQNSNVNLSEAEASRVLATLQYIYAGGLAVGIFIIIKLAPQWLLLGNFVLVVLGNVILLALGASNETWLWVGTACLRIGLSTAVPALLAYVQKYIFIDDTVSSFFTVSPGVLIALYPLLITNDYIERLPAVLIYCNFANIVAALVAFGILFRITYFRNNERN